MQIRNKGFLVLGAVLLASMMGGSTFAQAVKPPGDDLTKTAVEHGLSMAISGSELHALATRLQSSESEKLVKDAQKEMQDSSELLTAAYQEVKGKSADSPILMFYNAVSEYTKALMKQTESPTKAPAEEVAKVTQINCAVKSLCEAHKLEKKAKGKTSTVAEALRSHAQEMRSSARKTLDEVRQKAKAGSTVHKLATQAESISRALQQL